MAQSGTLLFAALHEHPPSACVDSQLAGKSVSVGNSRCRCKCVDTLAICPIPGLPRFLRCAFDQHRDAMPLSAECMRELHLSGWMMECLAVLLYFGASSLYIHERHFLKPRMSGKYVQEIVTREVKSDAQLNRVEGVVFPLARAPMQPSNFRRTSRAVTWFPFLNRPLTRDVAIACSFPASLPPLSPGIDLVKYAPFL